ncbi:hypothetical protein HZB58_02030 [Candidatus Gottesmanbacteria bacterium]|nr:hypothetical protein [Candidatus Gottesmanbacteria bacterium]
MKQTDVTQSVMEKVAEYEERRSKGWLAAFFVTLIIIGISITVLLYRAYGIMAERHTLDLFEILYQDKEIIEEFWADTFLVILAELPQRTVLLGGIFSTLLICVWIITRHRRRIVKRRLAELAKRKKSRNNTNASTKGVL